MKILLILALLGFLFLGIVNFSAKGNDQEEQAAFWNDGTYNFYDQLMSNDGLWLDYNGTAIFENLPVEKLSKEKTDQLLVEAKKYSGNVLGTSVTASGVEKWVEVDLSDFKLYAWEGNTKVFEFPTSTGRRFYETPTGEFKVWRKVRSQLYKGGSKLRGDYYYLPNVPYSLFFYNDRVSQYKGYALHGAYWHNDFGIKNRSSGCVNLKPEDAAKLYVWAGPVIPDGVGAINSTEDNPGIRVVIHD